MRALVLAVATLISSFSVFAALPTPSEVIGLALAKPLELVGKYVSPLSESGLEHCVFRNEDITLLYKYCMKDEAPAVSITLYPKASDVAIEVYAEGTFNASFITREFYFDSLWRVNIAKRAESYLPDMPIEAFAPYEVASDRALGCVVMYMEPIGNIARCFATGSIAQEPGAEWLVAAQAFWDAPTENWYTLQRQMRAAIEAMP